jgi:hypothetical protein
MFTVVAIYLDGLYSYPHGQPECWGLDLEPDWDCVGK